jgi:predicted RNase H-like HicB family nuclease
VHTEKQQGRAEKSRCGYWVGIEKGKNNYSQYLPDVTGCIATGRSPGIAMKRLAKALAVRKEDGLPLLEPNTQVNCNPYLMDPLTNTFID